MSEVELGLPCHIGDYTDFYTGIHHATAVGKLFRPDSPLMPNYRWIPIGYHGRASSIGVSGQSFRRPLGQTLSSGAATPVLGPCDRLDYELELGAFVAVPNPLGDPVSIADAEDHHPHMAVDYGRCALRFNTHSAGGVTRNDFICAAKIDALPGVAG